MSTTVTVKLQVAVFPEASVTMNVLVVSPTGKDDPDAKPAVCAVLDPEHKSVPVGAV